jgi:hypothetical protein
MNDTRPNLLLNTNHREEDNERADNLSTFWTSRQCRRALDASNKHYTVNYSSMDWINVLNWNSLYTIVDKKVIALQQWVARDIQLNDNTKRMKQIQRTYRTGSTPTHQRGSDDYQNNNEPKNEACLIPTFICRLNERNNDGKHIQPRTTNISVRIRNYHQRRHTNTGR